MPTAHDGARAAATPRGAIENELLLADDSSSTDEPAPVRLSCYVLSCSLVSMALGTLLILGSLALSPADSASSTPHSGTAAPALVPRTPLTSPAGRPPLPSVLPSASASASPPRLSPPPQSALASPPLASAHGGAPAPPPERSDLFVRASGRTLTLDGAPYAFVGINMWHAAWVGADDPGRLRRELDLLSASGVRVVRVVAASEGDHDAPLQVSPTLQPRPGEFDERMAAGLDLVLVELLARRMRAILTLNNMWTWSGGMATYLVWARGGDWRDIPYPSSHLEGYWQHMSSGQRPKATDADWHTYQVWASGFYSSPRAIELAEATIRFVLTRRNSRSGVLYADDPTILSYELCNEPRAVAASPDARGETRRVYLAWVRRTARLIKQLSPQHLVTVGSEGTTPFAEYVNNDFVGTHELADVDLLTIHVWAQNWGWGDTSAPLAACFHVRR